MVSFYLSKDILNNLFLTGCIIVITTQSQPYEKLISEESESDIESDIDQDHLKLYPYCGKLYGYAPNIVRSRVVNSKNSQTQYPWVVFIRTQLFKKDKTWKRILCSGTVITEK